MTTPRATPELARQRARGRQRDAMAQRARADALAQLVLELRAERRPPRRGRGAPSGRSRNWPSSQGPNWPSSVNQCRPSLAAWLRFVHSPAPCASRPSRSSRACRWPCSASRLLVHVRHLTGSFATAGIVAGAFAVSLGVGGPLLGRLVDRRGQTAVLVAARWSRAQPSRGPPRCRPARPSRCSSRWPSSWDWARRRSTRACAPSFPRSSATAKPCARPTPPSRPPSS